MSKPQEDEIANPNISQVLDRFLAEQRSTLSPRTTRQYESIVSLLKLSMNDYAPSYLDKSDSARFHRLYREGEVEFCDVFGPENIVSNISEFLSYFMIRKVVAGKETLRAAGTVTRKLVGWLEQKGYTTPSASGRAADTAARAAKLLPKGEECARLLYELGQHQRMSSADEQIEDYFTITRVKPGRLWLESLIERQKIGPVEVPEAVTDRCESGWRVALLLKRKQGKWFVAGAGSVHPL